MPWKECNIMDERMKFVSRMLEGEKMTDLCRASSEIRQIPMEEFLLEKVILSLIPNTL